MCQMKLHQIDSSAKTLNGMICGSLFISFISKCCFLIVNISFLVSPYLALN